MANYFQRLLAGERTSTPDSEQRSAIAIISDDQTLAKQAARVVEGAGASLRYAGVDQAIEASSGCAPELLLVDSRTVSQQAFIRLRRDERLSSTPCVFFVRSMEERDEVTRTFGICDFVSLPLEQAELVHRLRHLLFIRREGAKYLTRSDDRARFLEEGANVGTWEWQPNDDALLPSPALGTLIGTEIHRTIRTMAGWLDVVESSDRERVGRSYDALKAGEISSHQIEYRVQGETSVQWVQEQARVMEWSDGVPSRIFSMIANDTERRASERRIVQLVNYDTLTSLPNRNKCVEFLSQAIELASVRSDVSCLFRIDLSGIARINDSRGRMAGDEILQLVAERLKGFVLSPELVCRFGGKEFAIIRHGLSVENFEEEIQRLAADLQEDLERPYVLENEYFNCSCRVGASVIDESSIKAEQIIRKAEIALNHAERYQTSFALFQDVMMWQLEERTRFIRDLERAVFTDEFRLAYQPIVDPQGKVHGVEGLARWHHPVRGLVPPPDFIEAAEETGTIVPLGVRLRRQACQQLVKWSKDPALSHLTISVNVSPAEFKAKGFVRDVLVLVNGLKVPRDRLYLELTESILVGELGRVASAMEELRSAGVGLVLDDFGTGYSSLSYLRTLPFQRLKVDRSFVRNILSSPRDAGLARTILSMAQNLDLEAVVEGVEEEAQVRHLVEMGCSRFQGFYFARPGSVKDTESFARAPQQRFR